MDKVLITGASSGLGLELARQIAKQKRHLILSARDLHALEKIEEELSHITEVKTLCCDLRDSKDLDRLCDMIKQEKPSLVINNAGIGLYGEILIHTAEEQMNILKVNVDALTKITLTTALMLKEAGCKGVIMNISSAAGFLIYPGFSLYSASKAFVTHLSRSLDAELMPHGIRVLVSCPGQIKTSFRTRASKGIDKERQDAKTMTTSKAARLILNQIKKKKSYEIIDLRYKVMIFLARFFMPSKILQERLKKEIEKRISPF